MLIKSEENLASADEVILQTVDLLTKWMEEAQSDEEKEVYSLRRALVPGWLGWLKKESSGRGDYLRTAIICTVSQLVLETARNIAKDGKFKEVAGHMARDLVMQIRGDIEQINEAADIPGFRKHDA